MTKYFLAASTAFALLSTGAANAASVNFENFNYSGTVTSYGSEADARSGTNGTAATIATATNGSRSTLTDARDATIQADTQTGEFYFSTLWYYTPQGQEATNGFGNPNNSNNGFVQLYDVDGSTVSALDLAFNDDTTMFSLSATGSNLDPFSRLWNPPATGGPAVDTAGTFLDYALDFSATFGGMAATAGERTENPTSVSGSFKALFANSTDGRFYTADLTFGLGTAAARDDYFLVGSGTDFASSTEPSFIAPSPQPAPVPLPAALPMLLAAFGGFGFMRRKRRD